MKNKAFNGINHGKGRINLTKHKQLTNMLPVEVHLKEDGDINDGPSFALVMTREFYRPVVGEISLVMLNEGLADIGYQIVKKE